MNKPVTRVRLCIDNQKPQVYLYHFAIVDESARSYKLIDLDSKYEASFRLSKGKMYFDKIRFDESCVDGRDYYKDIYATKDETEKIQDTLKEIALHHKAELEKQLTVTNKFLSTLPN